jgi:hypothetical protein
MEYRPSGQAVDVGSGADARLASTTKPSSVALGGLRASVVNALPVYIRGSVTPRWP